MAVVIEQSTRAETSLRFPTTSRQLSESEDEQPKSKKSKKAKDLSIPAHATKELRFSDDEDAPSDDVSATYPSITQFLVQAV